MPFTPLDIATETTQAEIDTTIQSALVALQNILTEMTTGTLTIDSTTLATALAQDTGNSTLTALLAELGQKIEPGDLSTLATQTTAAAILTKLATVGLDAPTLAALESITIGTALPAGTNALGSVARTPLSSSATARVVSSATVVTLQAANANRRALKLFNESTAILYIKDGATATTTDYSVQVAAGGYYEWPIPIYQGIVTGIWSAANGAVQLTEGT